MHYGIKKYSMEFYSISKTQPSHFPEMTDATKFSCHYIEPYAPVGLAQKFKLLEKDDISIIL